MGLADLYSAQYEGSMGSPINASSGGGSSGGGVGGATVTSGVISSLTSIATTLLNAQAAKKTAKFNAGMAEIEGRAAKVAAKFEIARIRRRSDQIFGRQIAMYAKSGVKLEGSPAAVMLESLKEAEMDAIITDINAEYFGWQKQAQGDMYKMDAANVYTNAMLSAGAQGVKMGTNYLTRG